jgi:mono/diheme cytochrome c family protein
MLALAAIVLMAGCRQDMQNQPKFIPLRSNTFFPDQRSARYPVTGTVAKLDAPPLADRALEAQRNAELLDPGSYYHTGKHGAAFGNELPAWMPMTAALLDRGEQRFNIYCSPCHARLGDGNGMIVQRGYKHPPSFHQDRLRNAPVGYFFDIMSNGLGAMPDYSSQIKPADRWAIAAYIRALQMSQHATEADVAPQDRDKLSAPQDKEIKIPGTSTTSPTAMQPQGGVKP